MEQPQARSGGLPPSPEEAKNLIPTVRARIRIRADGHRRARMNELGRAAFSFNLFPRAPARNRRREAEAIWTLAWQDAGDHLRLAMLDHAAQKGK